MGRKKYPNVKRISTEAGRLSGATALRAMPSILEVRDGLDIWTQLDIALPRRERRRKNKDEELVNPIVIKIGSALHSYSTASPKVLDLRRIVAALYPLLENASRKFPLISTPLVEDDGGYSRGPREQWVYAPWGLRVAGLERSAWFLKEAKRQLKSAEAEDRAAQKKWGSDLCYCRYCGSPVGPVGGKEKLACNEAHSRLIAEMLRRIDRKSNRPAKVRKIARKERIITTADEIDLRTLRRSTVTKTPQAIKPSTLNPLTSYALLLSKRIIKTASKRSRA